MASSIHALTTGGTSVIGLMFNEGISVLVLSHHPNKHDIEKSKIRVGLLEIKNSVLFNANENSILSHNLKRTQCTVSGSSECSALIKANDESIDKSKAHRLL